MSKIVKTIFGGPSLPPSTTAETSESLAKIELEQKRLDEEQKKRRADLDKPRKSTPGYALLLSPYRENAARGIRGSKSLRP